MAAVIRVVAAVKPGACAAGEVEGVSALKRQAKDLSGGESLMSQCRGCLHPRQVPSLGQPVLLCRSANKGVKGPTKDFLGN